MKICVYKEDNTILSIINTEDLNKTIVSKGVKVKIIDDSEAFEEPCEANDYSLKLCDRINLGIFKAR